MGRPTHTPALGPSTTATATSSTAPPCLTAPTQGFQPAVPPWLLLEVQGGHAWLRGAHTAFLRTCPTMRVRGGQVCGDAAGRGGGEGGADEVEVGVSPQQGRVVFHQAWVAVEGQALKPARVQQQGLLRGRQGRARKQCSVLSGGGGVAMFSLLAELRDW